MTEDDWLNAADPFDLWAFVRDRARFHRQLADHPKQNYNRRLLYLLGAAACRRVASLFLDPCCHRVVEVAEEFAEGAATLDELTEAHDDVDHLRCTEAADLFVAGNAAALEAAFWLSPDQDKVIRTLEYVVDAAGYVQAVAARALPVRATLKAGRAVWQHPAFLQGKEEEERALCDLIRDVLGNLFRPSPPIDPSVLTWNGGIVPRLAVSAYEGRLLPSGQLEPNRLAVLADALEEAGCTEAGILEHLRGPGPHARGCHVLDLLAGKGGGTA
jgi:hypothetical protein